MAGQLGEEIQTQTPHMPQRVKVSSFRAVLAEAIMQQLLKGLEEQLDVFRGISLCGSCARRYCDASRFPEVMTGKNC